MSKLIKKIVSIATVLTLAVMIAGPVPARATTASDLQAQINDLLALLAGLQSQLSALEGGGSTTPGTVPTACVGITFNSNLKQGMSGSNVKCLQALLNTDSATQVAASGVGSAGSETTYFGSLTKAAVIKFQEKYASEILATYGLTKGTGYVGTTTRAKLNSMLSSGVTPPVDPGDPVVPPTSGLRVSLASDTPTAGYVAQGAYDRVFAKINVAAGQAVTINSITVTRGGVSTDADLSELKLYDGATQLGSTQALNTMTHKATFSGLNWAIAAGQVKVLTVKANIPSTGATQGNAVAIGIALVGDVVLSDSTVVVTGAPVYGNTMLITGASVGQLDVDANDAAVTGNVISGATDQKVGSFKFTASATEGFDVTSLTVTEIGTTVDSDIKNIKLKYLGTTLGTVSVLTGGEAMFTGSPLFSLTAGTTKDIDVYADVADGVTSARTVQFEVTDYNDVTAVGQNTGGVVRVTYSSGTAYAVQQSSTWTIVQGSLTVTLDTASTPSATNYVVGSTGSNINAFKFSAGAREGIKVTKLKLTKTNGGSGTVIDDAEFQNVQLYLVTDSVVSATPLNYVGSVSSGVITFTDENGLFEVPRASNIVVMVKADITTAADANDKLGFYINGVTAVEMKGSSSNAKISSVAANITVSGIDTAAETTAHTVVAEGGLTVALDADTPASQNITLGQENIEVIRFKLTATYESVRVASIKVRFYNASSITAAGNDAEATSTDYIASVKLYEGDVLIQEISTASAGYVTFSPNVIVPADGSKVYKVVVNVPTTSNLQYLAASVGTDAGDSYTAAADITSTGMMSSQDIDETGAAHGNVMSLQTPTLVVAAATAPPSQSIVSNTGEAWLGRLQLTGAYEDVKVTRVRITLDDAAALSGASSAEDVFSEIKLKVGSTQIGTTLNISDAGGGNSKDIVTFSGISNLTVGKDQTVSLDVYGKVMATSTDTNNLTWYIGHASNTDIVGSGIYSNTAVNSTGGVQVSQGATLRSSGTLTVSVAADTPIDTNVGVGNAGKSGVAFSKIKFEAAYEDMKVTTVKLTLTDPDGSSATTVAASYDFDSVSLYDGETLIATAPITGTTVSFYKDTGLFTVPNLGSKVITVKANLWGVANGSYSGDAPKLYIANLQDSAQMRGVGASSNASTSATDGTVNPETAGNFGAMYLYKTVVTVKANSSMPSGTQTSGSGKEVFRMDVTADAAAGAVVNKIALSLSGSVDITGTGSAYLYKVTGGVVDTGTALATEAVVGPVTLQGGSAAATTATTTAGGFDGIPVGATIHILDGCSGTTWRTGTVKYIAEQTAGNQVITFDAAVDAVLGDCIYYMPLQPSSTGVGKLFFGAYSNLAASTSFADTTVTLNSTDGFAPGDTVILTGYDYLGAATTSASLTVATTTETVLSFDSAVNVRLQFDYFRASAVDADYGPAVAYTNGTTNSIEEGVDAGNSKTFVVWGDTSGSGGGTAESLGLSIASAADFGWDDTVQRNITGRTTSFPVSTTLNYQ